MCELCLAKVISYSGEVLPGVYLRRATTDGNIMEAGDFGLVFCNDPSFVFSIVPECEPPEDNDKQLTEFFNWAAKVEMFEDQLAYVENDFGIIYCLVEAGTRVGYNFRSGRFSAWLFNHIGEYLKTATITVD